MSNVPKFIIERKYDSTIVAIMIHKDGSGYGFVNLTKGQVYASRFPTIAAAIEDLKNNPRILKFTEIIEKRG